MANTTLFSSIKSKFVRTDAVNEAGGQKPGLPVHAQARAALFALP